VSKAGKVRKRLGRPGAEVDKLDSRFGNAGLLLSVLFDWARRELTQGTGICKTAKLTGLGTGTVHKLRREMRTV
jgi:hypothetical protein